MAQRPKKLLDHVRDAIRLKHYSRHTEEAYVTWIKRFMFFHDTRHPKDMGAAEIEAFLTHLAVQQKVAASTQNQALSALLFIYRDVLRHSLDGPIDAIRARKPKRLPTVLTKEEALQVIGALSGIHALMGKLLYGTGMRLMECLRLRVKDLDFAQRQLLVRDGKGLDDRVTMLPASLVLPLQEHLSRITRPAPPCARCRATGRPSLLAVCAGGQMATYSYVYVLGRVEPRFPGLAVEKELAQASGRAETAGLTDRQALYAVLSRPENRYLVVDHDDFDGSVSLLYSGPKTGGLYGQDVCGDVDG
jgi:site-specific recombinase XerD